MSILNQVTDKTTNRNGCQQGSILQSGYTYIVHIDFASIFFIIEYVYCTSNIVFWNLIDMGVNLCNRVYQFANDHGKMHVVQIPGAYISEINKVDQNYNNTVMLTLMYTTLIIFINV